MGWKKKLGNLQFVFLRCSVVGVVLPLHGCVWWVSVGLISHLLVTIVVWCVDG